VPDAVVSGISARTRDCDAKGEIRRSKSFERATASGDELAERQQSNGASPMKKSRMAEFSD